MTVSTKKDNSFGRLIQKHRLQLGYRLVDVALATGKSKQKIHDYEQGNRNPPKDPIFLTRLSEYLNIPITLLIDKSTLVFNRNNPKLRPYLKVIRDKAIAATVQDRMATLKGLLGELRREMGEDGVRVGLQKIVENAENTLKDIEVSISNAA